MPFPTPTSLVSRARLVQSLAQGLQFGRTRIHHGDDLMARLAAEKLADFLAEADLAVVHTAAPPNPGEQCRPGPPEPVEES